MDQSNFSLRSYYGKKLVAYLRNGDYAHAGEAEAIDLVMQRFDKNKDREILDVGCGLGGTASYLYQNQWGKVTAIDIEAASIDYANQKYLNQNIKFYVSDVINSDKIFKDKKNKKFDVIVLFNAFYAFNDQPAALTALAKIAQFSGQIAIFDYSDPLPDNNTPLFQEGNIVKKINCFKPIKIKEIENLLKSTGWLLSEMINVSENYIVWYKNLLDKLLYDKDFIIAEYNQASFDRAYQTYYKIWDALVNNLLGGVIVYGEKL